jgi:D-2-hydroxyacid dehydrogenase (NADP+)
MKTVLPLLGIFLSEEVQRTEGAALAALCASAGVTAELIVHDRHTRPDARALQNIRLALLSVDVIGKSTKTLLEPEMQTFVQTLRDAPHLQWLQVPSAGMDRPLYDELYDRGIQLTSSAGANSKAVAQTAVAGILALSRCIPLWLESQKLHRWHPLRGELIPQQLDGQHAVIVGTGAIGQNIARTLQAMDMRVTGVRRSAAALPHFDEVVSFDALDSVLPTADWLVLACPLTDLTRNLLHAPRLKAMRRSARVINVARGEVIDEAALVNALRDGHIAGAYLDVFAVEPLPAESPLWDLPQVLISAHSAGNSTGHQRNVVAQFKTNLLRFIQAQSLVNEWKPRVSATLINTPLDHCPTFKPSDLASYSVMN